MLSQQRFLEHVTVYKMRMRKSTVGGNQSNLIRFVSDCQQVNNSTMSVSVAGRPGLEHTHKNSCKPFSGKMYLNFVMPLSDTVHCPELMNYLMIVQCMSIFYFSI